jgi:hypothetical protein
LSRGASMGEVEMSRKKGWSEEKGRKEKEN